MLRRRPVVAAVLVLSSLRGAALAADAPARALPPLLPREVVFGNPDRAHPQLSPDGKRLGYLRADERGVLQVWVATVGASDDRPVTKEATRGVRDWFFGRDGSVLYLQDQGGNENHHLFRADPATGETKDLTPFPGARVGVLAHHRERPGEVIVGANARDPREFDLHRVDLATGTTTLLEKNPGGALHTVVDRAHRPRVALFARPGGGHDVKVRRAPDDPTWTPLLSTTAEERIDPEGLSADGRTLYAKTDLGHDTAALEAIDLETGARTVLAKDPGVDAGTVLSHEETGVPQAVSFARDRPRWHVLDASLRPDFEALERLAAGAAFGVASRDDADRTWVVVVTGDVVPARWVLWDRATRTAKPLFSSRAALEGAVLSPMRPVEVKARDGLMLPTLVTVPAGVEAKALPTVVLVHGGPWARDRWGFDPQAQWLANRGYAVLQVNYRGSTGFGKRHRLAARREFAGKMHTDLLDALDWAVAEGIADPERVAIMGGSYGGYATLVGLAFTPERFACGVDIVGPSNLVSLVESFPPYWRDNLASTWYPFVGDPSKPEERKDMEARSPLFHVDKIRAPLLVGQGANDPRVTKKESDQIVEAIRARGGVVEYVVYPDEGHGFARPQNRLDFYARAEAFLARHLGGRAE